jgi:hypothetical protein
MPNANTRTLPFAFNNRNRTEHEHREYIPQCHTPNTKNDGGCYTTHNSDNCERERTARIVFSLFDERKIEASGGV